MFKTAELQVIIIAKPIRVGSKGAKGRGATKSKREDGVTSPIAKLACMTKCREVPINPGVTTAIVLYHISHETTSFSPRVMLSQMLLHEAHFLIVQYKVLKDPITKKSTLSFYPKSGNTQLSQYPPYPHR
jgi:hypothetical protein